MSSISFTDLHNTNPGKVSLWERIAFIGQLKMWWMALHCWKIPPNAFNPTLAYMSHLLTHTTTITLNFLVMAQVIAIGVSLFMESEFHQFFCTYAYF
jgi:hypothetical protein